MHLRVYKLVHTNLYEILSIYLFIIIYIHEQILIVRMTNPFFIHDDEALPQTSIFIYRYKYVYSYTYIYIHIYKKKKNTYIDVCNISTHEYTLFSSMIVKPFHSPVLPPDWTLIRNLYSIIQLHTSI
jgi:hypothetical protein